MSNLDVCGHVGDVVHIEGEFATVRFRRSSMCKHCGACLAVGEKEVETKVVNALHAELGDRVRVEIPGKHVVSASVLAYGIPLAALLLGVGIGGSISDIGGLLGGTAGCALAFLLLRLMGRKCCWNEVYMPHMTAILDDDEIKEADDD